MAIFVNTGPPGRTLNIRDSIERCSSDGRRHPDPAVRRRPAGLRRARWARAPSSRCTSGCRTRWRARPRCPPSSTRPRWSTPASTSWPAPTRCSPRAPDAMVVVAGIGIFTAILAASIAMTQTDIKRVLAYSTLSQLGYMFAALGVGAFTAAIFHLMTHGFFKGLLFLGSGSVIHAVHEEQDMRRMGGLSKKIPITYATMLIGSLAIAGIPPLAGFFSKDEILGEVVQARVLLGLGDRPLRRAADRVLHVPAHGPDVLGRVPRPEGDLGQDPRVAAGHDRSRSSCWPSRRSSWAWPSACRSAPARSTTGSSRSSHEAEHARRCRTSRTQLFGIDGVLILASVTVAVVGIAARLAASSGRTSAGSGMPARPERVRELSAAAGPAVPLPRVAQQVVVRRPQPPAVHRHRRTHRRRRCGGSTARSSTAPSTASAALDRRAPGAACAASRPGRVQNYALGIAIGLIVMAGSYLVLAGSGDGPRPDRRS